MPANESAISKITLARGKRPAATAESPARGKRASVRTAPPASDPPEVEEKETIVTPPALVAEAPRKRGPKPGSKRTPREPVVREETGAFDAGSVSKGLKVQLKQLKAAAKEEQKEYNTKSKALQSELSRISKDMEKLENAHMKASAGFATGIHKVEAVLSSLE